MSKVSDTWPHPLAKAAAAGCCGDDAWRGRLCAYHDGFADGLEAMEEYLEEGRRSERRLFQQLRDEGDRC